MQFDAINNTCMALLVQHYTTVPIIVPYCCSVRDCSVGGYGNRAIFCGCDSCLLSVFAARRDGPSQLLKQANDAIWELDAAWGLPEGLQLCHLLCLPCYAGTPHNTPLAVPAHIIVPCC
jgi:hypothetical protein